MQTAHKAGNYQSYMYYRNYMQWLDNDTFAKKGVGIGALIVAIQVNHDLDAVNIRITHTALHSTPLKLARALSRAVQ
jgi:3-methyladenine DNA glycosylase Mpg